MAVRVIEEIGLKAMENCSILIPVLLGLLRDNDSVVARESIVSGTHLYCGVLEEMALQVSFCLYPTIPLLGEKSEIRFNLVCSHFGCSL